MTSGSFYLKTFASAAAAALLIQALPANAQEANATDSVAAPTSAPAAAPDATAATPAAPAAPAAPTAPAPAFTATANVGLFTQYVFRGLTQTNEKPALQGGFDVSHESGLYAGIWGSNISWISDATPGASASLEADLYGGYKYAVSDTITTDIGFLHYAYPGTMPAGSTSANTNEDYVGVDAKWISLRYSYSLGDTFGAANTRGTSYTDLTVSQDLFAGISGVAHIGRQAYTGSNSGNLSYTDWKLGVSRDFSGYVVGAFYTDTNAKNAGYFVNGKNLGRSHVVLSLSHTL